MEAIAAIKVHRIKRSGIGEVDFSKLEFGKYVSDHMLICDYTNNAWQEPQITPFTNLSMSPSTLALHYGQTVFEGMKAFRMHDGRISIFRMDKHYDRFVKSLERMCMQVIPKEVFVEGMAQLIAEDKAWVPTGKSDALYIRPFMYASEARFGVKISDDYRFIVFTGPVPTLYPKPVKVKVETQFTRAARGGTGAAKCGGNYGGSYYPTLMARNKGYDQVLWTDGRENKYIEESGMMNVCFIINGKLVTPALSDSILDGVTRDSLLILAKDAGIPVEERPVSIEELETAFRNKTITEAFGAGTAAVVLPIKAINIHGTEYDLPDYNEHSILFGLQHELELIRSGQKEDRYGWNYVL